MQASSTEYSRCCIQAVKRALRRPPLKSGHSEERHHGHQNVVKIELAVIPHPLTHGWHMNFTILVHNIGSPVKDRKASGQVCNF